MMETITPSQALARHPAQAALARPKATLKRSRNDVQPCPAPHGGAVAQAGPGPFELLSARRLIEPELAAMAARVATDGCVDAILAAAGQMEHVQGELADRHFHLTLAHASGNAALASALEHLWNQRGGLYHTLEQLFGAGEQRQETLADYGRIARAIAARDPAAARNAMRAHLERFTRTLSRG